MDITIQLAIIGGIITLITGGIASIPGILALRSQKKKTNAEASKTEADAAQIVQNMAIALIDPYRKRVEELEKLVKSNNGELTTRIEKLETALEETFDCLLEVSECAHALYDQIKAKGGDPICEPPSKDILEAKKESLNLNKTRKKKSDNTL